MMHGVLGSWVNKGFVLGSPDVDNRIGFVRHCSSQTFQLCQEQAGSSRAKALVDGAGRWFPQGCTDLRSSAKTNEGFTSGLPV